MTKEKMAKIHIGDDALNKDKEQYKIFQRDGETIEVPLGRYVDVPLWVAERAKEIGVIDDYITL